MTTFFTLPSKTEKRVKGIEPSQPAWKAGALPLSYTRIGVVFQRFEVWVESTLVETSMYCLSILKVRMGEAGFEPAKA